jgi:hypothetical protein
MNQKARDYLSNLTDQEVKAIVSNYKKFEVSEDLVKAKSIDGLDDIGFITKLLKFTGCVYDEEIEAFLKCLRKEIELHRKGVPVMFNPSIWGDLMQIEKLFGISL